MSDVEGQSTCTGCGKPIRWVLTVGGKRMPLDPDPTPEGTVVRAVLEDGAVRAKVLTGAELPALVTAWRPHWVTCPNSAEFHRRRAVTTPRCRACGQPLDRVWADAGHAYHVLCAPPGEFREHVDAHRPTAPTEPDTGHEQQELSA